MLAATSACKLGGQRRRAFDACGVLFQVQFHQPVQPRQDLRCSRAASFRAQQRNRLPDAVFVQQTIDLATAEQLPGFTQRLFGNFHFSLGGNGQSSARRGAHSVSRPTDLCCQLLFRFLGEPALVFGGQHLAGDGRGGLHDQPADFAFQLGEHPRMVLRGGFARPGQ